MSLRFLVACLLAVSAGCGKGQTPSPSSTEPATNNPAPSADASATATQAAPTGASADAAQLAAVLGELTQVVRKYSVEQRRVPKTFDELVAAGYLTRLPEAPAGKAFAINKNLQVYLGNR